MRARFPKSAAFGNARGARLGGLQKVVFWDKHGRRQYCGNVFDGEADPTERLLRNRKSFTVGDVKQGLLRVLEIGASQGSISLGVASSDSDVRSVVFLVLLQNGKCCIPRWEVVGKSGKIGRRAREVCSIWTLLVGNKAGCACF